MESRREKEEENRKDHCVQQALKQEFVLCFQAACGWALKQTHNARGFFFCFILCFVFLSKWEGEKAKGEKMEWRQWKSVAERDQKRSENKVVESMREASVGSSWRPSVKSERWRMCTGWRATGRRVLRVEGPQWVSVALWLEKKKALYMDRKWVGGRLQRSTFELWRCYWV